MTWQVLLRARAEADLKEARDWYEERQTGLGENFIDAMSAAMAQLATAPARHSEYYRGFRRLLLGHFPYKVFYRIQGNAVIVFRVLHGRQDHTSRLRRR